MKSTRSPSLPWNISACARLVLVLLKAHQTLATAASISDCSSASTIGGCGLFRPRYSAVVSAAGSVSSACWSSLMYLRAPTQYDRSRDVYGTIYNM